MLPKTRHPRRVYSLEEISMRRIIRSSKCHKVPNHLNLASHNELQQIEGSGSSKIKFVSHRWWVIQMYFRLCGSDGRHRYNSIFTSMYWLTRRRFESDDLQNWDQDFVDWDHNDDFVFNGTDMISEDYDMQLTTITNTFLTSDVKRSKKNRNHISDIFEMTYIVKRQKLSLN